MSSDIEIDLDDEFEWVDADVINELEETNELNRHGEYKSDISSEHEENLRRKSDIGLYKFIASLSQIEHNFYSKDFNPHDLPFLSERITSNVSIARKIANAFDYKINNLTHIYYFNILLRQVSYLSSAASHLGTSIEEAINDDDYIDKIKEVNIEGAVILEGELATNEVSMHIKSVLIPYCIYFESTISSNFSNFKLNDYLEIVIDITKTLATRWNKQININKRHLLFTSALDTVARFVLNYIYKEIGNNAQSKMSSVDIHSSSIWDRVEHYHLGINDYPSKKDILIEKIDAIVNSEINDYYLRNKTLNSLVSKDRARLWLLSGLGNTWLDFHDSVISKLQMMKDGERDEYIVQNKNIPDLASFYEAAGRDCKKMLKEIQLIEFDLKKLVRSIKQDFSSLWGVSDAYCKTVA